MTQSLIQRLEAAGEGSRELDVAILTQVLGYRDIHGDGSLFDRGNDGYWTLCGDEKNRELPSPTTSVDDAIELVPEGAAMSVGQNVHHLYWGAHIQKVGEDGEPQIIGYSGRRNNPAIALCIAALRARGIP